MVACLGEHVCNFTEIHKTQRPAIVRVAGGAKVGMWGHTVTVTVTRIEMHKRVDAERSTVVRWAEVAEETRKRLCARWRLPHSGGAHHGLRRRAGRRDVGRRRRRRRRRRRGRSCGLAEGRRGHGCGSGLVEGRVRRRGGLRHRVHVSGRGGGAVRAAAERGAVRVEGNCQHATVFDAARCGSRKKAGRGRCGRWYSSTRAARA